MKKNETQSEKNRSKPDDEKYNTEKNRMDYEGGNQGDESIKPEQDKDDSNTKQPSLTNPDTESDA